MNKTLSNEQRTLKCGTLIIVLALIALVSRFLGSTTAFAFYEPIIKDNGDQIFKLIIPIPSFLDLIIWIVECLPAVLFALYVIVFFKKSKGTIIFSMVFGCYILEFLLLLIRSIVIFRAISFISLIAFIICTIIYILAIISALKGLSNKIIIIILSAFFVLLGVMTLIILSELDVSEGLIFNLITGFANGIFNVTFHFALILFVVENRIPAILAVSHEKEMKKLDKMSPDKALPALKDMLDNGVITEEEYQSKRADIIDKL